MGTIIISQKRGKGGPIYRTPTHRYVSDAKYPQIAQGDMMRAQVIELVHDPSKDVLLAKLLADNKKEIYLLAAEGMKVGQTIEYGKNVALEIGNITTLENVPDSAMVFDVELTPNDGGRLARTSGAFVSVISHDEDNGTVEIKLASKRTMSLSKECRATFGIASGAGRTEKPLKKAGTAHYKWHSRNKGWPVVRGTAMSAYDHPHGGKSMGKSSMRKRGTPPGKYVGHRAASRVGRKMGKMDKSEEKQ
ncbi:50S ribosomal protein L2 [Candidatus Micrarchaeota archaeon]|nr:50S ribosomal protein L2 [Candidatus Micrarchaeota archaeon]